MSLPPAPSVVAEKPRDTPFLNYGDRIDSGRTKELIDRLRRGGDVLVRSYPHRTASVEPAVSRLRKLLGDDYYVWSVRGSVWARARRVGEPVWAYGQGGGGLTSNRDWMTLKGAAEELGITVTWLREAFINRGKLTVHRVIGRRVMVRGADVRALKAQASNPFAHIGAEG